MERTKDYYEMRAELLTKRNATVNAPLIAKYLRKVRRNATKDAFTDFDRLAAEVSSN